jgi:hypothetical protein
VRRTSAALVDWRVVCRLTARPEREHRIMDPASRIQPASGLPAFTVITTPAPIQRGAFGLLGVSRGTGYASAGHLKITAHFRRQMLYRAPMQRELRSWW